MSQNREIELRIDVPGYTGEKLTIVRLPDGKVVVAPKGRDCHFTFHPGHASGFLDVHKTMHVAPANSASRHETMLRLRTTDVVDAVTEIAPTIVTEALDMLRPIRLGWIVRRRLTLAFLPAAPIVDVVSKIVLTVAREESDTALQRVRFPEFCEEIYDEPNSSALLFDLTGRNSTLAGLVFRFAEPNGTPHLYWVRQSDMRRFSTRWQRVLLDKYDDLRQKAATSD